jgi:HEAT repeat protein
MRRSRLLLIGLGIVLVGYLAFAVYSFRDRLQRCFGRDYPEHKLSTEPIVEGRPLHEWVAELNDDKPSFRRHAAEVLGETGKAFPRDQHIPELLAGLLKDRDPTVRQAAAEALGRVHVWARRTSNQLCEAAADDNPEVRCKSLAALATLVDDEAALTALRQGLKDSSPTVREQTLAVLTQIGPQSQAAVALLAETLKASDVDMRHKAIGALSWIGPEAKPALVAVCDALRDSDISIRREAAAAVAAITERSQSLTGGLPGNDDQEEPDRETKTTVAALAVALNDTDVGVRQNVLKALRGLGHQAKSALASLLVAAKDSDAEVRAGTADVLGSIGPAAKEAVPTLLEMLKDANSHVRAHVAIALTRVDAETKTIVVPLRAALSDTDEEVRASARSALCTICQVPDRLSDDEYAEIVLSILRADQPKEKDTSIFWDIHPSIATSVVPRLATELEAVGPHQKESVFKGLADALERISYATHDAEEKASSPNDRRKQRLRAAIRRLVPRLIETLKSSNGELHYPAVKILSVIGPEAEPAIPILCDVLRSPDQELDSFALQALGNLGPAAKVAVPCLIDRLKDTKYMHRYGVARTLGKIGPEAKAAAGPLRECLQSSDISLRLGAREALLKIDPEAAKQAGVE